MMATTSSNDWRSGRNAALAAVGVAGLALVACGGPGATAVLDLDPRAAACYTDSRRALDVQPAPGGADAWAATEGGLIRFGADGGVLDRYTRADGLAANGVRRLALAPDGALWIATDGGVSRLRRGTLVSFDTEDGLEDERCLAIAVGADGVVYVGTEKGVSRFDGRRFEPFRDTHEFSRRATYDIHVAADGTIWFAKENALTHWLGGSEWEVFQRDPLLSGPRARMVSNSVRSVATDGAHRPWIGTHRGLGHLDEEGWSHLVFADRFYDGSGPRDNRIAALAVAPTGSVWIGHGDSKDFEGGVGAARFERDRWRYFTVADGLPDNRVHRVRLGENGATWLATSNGVALYRDGSFERFASAGDLPDNHVTGLWLYDGGWVAVTTPVGTAWFENGQPRATPGAVPRPWRAGESAGPDGAELRDATGARWVGTRTDGLWRHDARGWTEVRLGGRRLPRNITALLFENERTLWVGTANEGAIRLRLRSPDPSETAAGGS